MVRVGYKRTEVGVIPEDWEKGTLEGKVDLISGQHVVQANYNNNNLGVPYLTGPADFKKGKTFVTKWTEENRIKATQGDILITVKGSGSGKVFCLDIPNAVISRQLMAIKCNQVQPQYIYYFLKGLENKLSVKAVGNLIPGLNRGDILKQPLLFPPDKEQQAIAQALSDVDALIKGLQKLIAKKQNIKTAAMQQLLTGKIRLPGFGEGKGYQQTELGEIPEDWDVVTDF